MLVALVAPSACSIERLELHDDDTKPVPALAAALLHFEEADTITLAPGEARTVRVVASPDAVYEVRFALIGDALDGWIESAAVKTDARGVASMRLHAPNQPTTFHLRASIVLDDGQAGPSAETSVAVSAQGFGTVRVRPQYAGKRPVESWTASVVARTTCSDLGAILPGEPEGALVAKAPYGEAPSVLHAPVGPNLAVAVRAGHFAWGCADTADLKADGTLDVKVTIVDKPIDLGATNLDLALTYQPDAADYGALTAAATQELVGSFVTKGATDAALLLTAMREAAPADQATAFDAARSAQHWDEAAAAHFDGLKGTLRGHATAWIKAGLPLQPPVIKAHLGAKPGAPGAAALQVVSIGSIDAASAGVPATSDFTWMSDPDDTLILGGVVIFEPSRFVGAAALAGARIDRPDAASMGEVLAEAVDCAGLAAKLGGFGVCDAACTEALCAAGLDARWSAGLGASAEAGQLGHLALTASGLAQLDDTAAPLAFKGKWLGSVTDGPVSAQVKGSFESAPPDDIGSP